MLRIGPPDRRRTFRDPVKDLHRADLVQRILSHYAEMPGLCLDIEAAAKMLGISAETCSAVLRDLLAAGDLRETADGRGIIATAARS